MLQCKLPQLHALMFYTHYISVLIQTRYPVVLLFSNHQLITEKLYPILLILFWSTKSLVCDPTDNKASAGSHWGKCLSRATPNLHTVKAVIESMFSVWGLGLFEVDKEWLWTLDLLIYPTHHRPQEWHRLLPTQFWGHFIIQYSMYEVCIKYVLAAE